MAALIPDERCVVLACSILFLSKRNMLYPGPVCHLQGDGAPLTMLFTKLTFAFTQSLLGRQKRFFKLESNETIRISIFGNHANKC